MFGVGTLLTVLSIMGGYITRLQEMIREQEADLVIRGTEPRSLSGLDEFEKAVSEVPGVRASAPYVRTFGMYRSGRFNPCFMRGMDPAKELEVTQLGRFIFRPDELDSILEDTENIDTAEAFQSQIEDRSRQVLSRPERVPLDSEDAVQMFSLDWREELFDRENPEFRGEFFSRDAPGGILVGIHFFANRNLQLGEVVKVLTINPKTNEPIHGKFLVVGAFKTGDYDMDSRSFLVHFNRLSSFLQVFDAELNDDRFDGIRLSLDDPASLEETKKRVELALEKLPPWTGAPFAHVESWRDTRQNFIQAVRIEKWTMGFVVSLLNIFTSGIILLMLVLIVIEKTRDAGILLAVGARPTGVFSIFLLTGVFITILGTVLGIAAGAAFVNSINVVHDLIYQWTGHRLFDPEVYLMDRIPVRTTPEDIFFSIVPAIVFSLGASLVPALWAARKDPIHAIHYE
jgi:lipoprotein-releasing system permease protein